MLSILRSASRVLPGAASPWSVLGPIVISILIMALEEAD